MKPKEILLRDGKITAITRGRISRENHEYLASLAAKGEKIDGYEVKVSSKPTGEKVFSNGTAPVSTEKQIADIGPARFDERETEAYYFEGGKKIGISLREVCSNCMGSFSYHKCDSPVYRVDFDRTTPVYFGERKTPFKKGW